MGAGLLILAGVALVGYLLVAPLVAFVFAVRANRRNEDLLLRIHALEHRVAELSGQRGRAGLAEAQHAHNAGAIESGRDVASAVASGAVAAALGASSAVTDAPTAGAPTAADDDAAAAPSTAATTVAADDAAAAPSTAATTVAGDDAAAAPSTAATTDATATPSTTAADVDAAAPSTRAADAATAAPSTTAATDAAAAASTAADGAVIAFPAAARAESEPPAVAAATASRSAAALGGRALGEGAPARQGGARRASIEERLGLTWLTRAGVATFLLGTLFFFKYAADNDWIGPTGRVALGAATGAALLVTAEAIRRRTRRRFVHALIGLGLAVLIASVWASVALYELVPIAAAFVVDAALLLLGAALALRHRGEAILSLTLIAGFLTPVVLSTGQDRPLLLFGYLLLMTSGVHAVSAKLGFRVAPWLALVGHAALFSGWYVLHFDAGRAPADPAPGAAPWLDLPAEALADRSLPLTARAVPLAFVALAASQGVLRALWMHARRASASSATAGATSPRDAAPTGTAPRAASADDRALAVAALVLAHAGAGALLLDSPRALAAAALALALGATFALRALEARGLLLAPMGAAFLAFAATLGDAPAPHRATLVVMTTAWALVYLAGWLRGHEAAHRLDGRTAIACAVGAALFAGTQGVLLLGAEAALFALALAIAAAFVAWLDARAEMPALLLAAALASAGALAAAAPGALATGHAAPIDAPFLGAAALVMLVFLGAAVAAARRRAPGAPALSWPGALAASVATLGFVAAALGATPDDTPTLRALLIALAGALDLALGAALVRNGSLRGAASAPAARLALLLGQALALFAMAVAFGLSGATVTVVWAVLAAVAGSIAARTAERAWLLVALLLFLAALVRAFAVDLAETEALFSTWLASRGRDGAMAAPVLRNARACAFAGVGLALVVAGRMLSRAPAAGAARAGAELRAARLTALGSGYALLIVTLVVEVQGALTVLPAPPPFPLDAAEFAELIVLRNGALDAQRGSLAMATTLVLALAAIALLTAGFAARDAFHRHAGLALFAVTIAKLVAWDVWHVERVYQIALFTGVGALLVGGGLLYARFGRRLVTLLRSGPGGAAGLLALLATTSFARPADAQAGAPLLSTERHPLVRMIEGVDAPGDYRVDLDLDLYRESRADELLADVRIAGPDGAEVPYVLRDVGATPSSGRIAATMLDPGVDAAGVSHATWALDAPGTRHCRIELSVLGSAFLREVRVDTGADPRSLTEVARGAYVYRIPRGAETVEHLEVSYPLSRAALVRVRLLPEDAPARGEAASVRITGGVLSCARPPAGQGSLLPLAIVEAQRDDGAGTTAVTLDAGVDGVPLQAIHLDVATPEFTRRVEVAATTYRAVWPAVGSGLIYRILPYGEGGVTLSSTRIPLNPTRKRFVRLTIHDGDSAPLSITGARGEVRAREIVLRASHAGPHWLYVGDALGDRPRYDLADVLDRIERDGPPITATLGAAQRNPAFGAVRAARDLPFTERHRTPIGVVLTLGLLSLSVWVARLVRQAAPPADVPPAPEGSRGRDAPSSSSGWRDAPSSRWSAP